MSPQGHHIGTVRRFGAQRVILLMCAVILVAFVVFVAVATQDSDPYYLLPYALLAIASLVVVCVPRISRSVLVGTLALNLVGVLIALVLVLGFANYYQHNLEHQRRLDTSQ